MKKILIILIGLLCLASCATRREAIYYNVIFTQNGHTQEYYDVTNLSKFDGNVYFTTCDGATVILSAGAIEIIPIDVD